MSFLFDELKQKMGNNDDFVCRELEGKSGKLELYFLKSMTDKDLISSQIIKPYLSCEKELSFEQIKSSILLVSEYEDIQKEQILEKVLKNNVILNFKGSFISIDLEKVPTRMPSEPPVSPNIYGPREGFVENINTNIALLRKRLATKNLIIKDFTVGTETSTRVSVAYLKNIARKDVVKEVLKKIKSIDIDGIIDTYYVAEFLKHNPKSIFEQVAFQEKPDIVVAKILEGRVAVMVDGSPMVLTIPFMIFEDLQSSNDYYTNYLYVSLVRIIRTFGIIVATIIPGLYLALRLYSYSVFPLTYVIVIANSTKNLPFTPVLEIAFIILLFQILYEVSLRLPQYLGLATSIVGALVLGDTGVKAGLISPPGVVIIAVSIMAIYTVPSQAAQLTILRLVFMVLGSTLGIMGIIGGVVYIVNYLNTLNAYNTPFLAPFAPKVDNDLQDGILKKPLIEMNKRPLSLNIKNIYRQNTRGKDE